MIRILRPQFGISSILLLTTVIAVVLAMSTNRARRKARVIATYDAQKANVVAVANDFARELESEGFIATHDAAIHHGSGDWRACLVLKANKGGEVFRCRVEVMGFVSHNSSDAPTWMSILPLTVSFKDNPLDNRLVARLSSAFSDRDWRYELNPPSHRFRCP